MPIYTNIRQTLLYYQVSLVILTPLLWRRKIYNKGCSSLLFSSASPLPASLWSFGFVCHLASEEESGVGWWSRRIVKGGGQSSCMSASCWSSAASNSHTNESTWSQREKLEHVWGIIINGAERMGAELSTFTIAPPTSRRLCWLAPKDGKRDEKAVLGKSDLRQMLRFDRDRIQSTWYLSNLI